MQLTERIDNQSGDTRDTLMLLSGVSLVIFGAGLILTTPVVKKLLGGAGIGALLQAAGPDLQRYLKLKEM
ncbi:MAG: hypothetical protein WBE37_05690 [Bryobacteraceae bacterium]